ncbi:Rab proteins geranylgeranyltransferase component A 1 [Araneus ventricosus]|uniref:Rab proteins geranylgeranyltransferase component A n=1 Tax=Araneus ventricosus TaxID=182803 RepID=A0A4Y2H0S3_ARAVE|nr:Rab proteins geranylgeranyltransferase component A 1 [Araneus ventricosus]
MEDLPNYFDVIVVGTGMPECIIAAAAARVGKKVLHLDRNGYYGGDWASFSYDKFLEWMNEIQSSEQPCQTPIDLVTTLASFVREEETLYTCPLRSRTITNLAFKSFVKDSPDPPPAAESESSGDAQLDQASGGETKEENETVLPSNSDSAGESAEQVRESSDTDSVGQNADSNDASPEPVQDVPQLQHEWTTSEFMENRRKFNIDLAPKIMFSRGSLVELLISSNIARYAEFQCITRVLTCINGLVQQVPCSRADVFSTKNVTVVEKRMLMKFLNFCLKFEEQTEEFQGYEDKPFIEFLRSKKLTSNVEHYVIHAIAMVDETCSTLKGLQATQKFLQSLGRYGKTPFICTCYGSAELPQCFCRLCAVYEGMYYLKRKVDGVIFNNDNKCCAIISRGQRIGCEWLVMESSYAPGELIPPSLPQRISRAILITDASLHSSENKENTLLRLPPQPGVENPITVLELGSKNYVCPEDLYLVYMICRSSNATAEEDLKSAVELLFSNGSADASEDKPNQKPNVLWSVYFNQRDTSTISLNENLPSGVFLTSSPDLDLDYEHAVKEARDIFEAMCPGEEFLPRAPDPEDILIEMHNNPGDEGEGGKIENDVNGLEEDANAHEQNVVNDEVVTEQNVQESPEKTADENEQ